MLRTFQAQNVKKIGIFSFGSASAAKLEAGLIKTKECRPLRPASQEENH